MRENDHLITLRCDWLASQRTARDRREPPVPNRRQRRRRRSEFTVIELNFQCTETATVDRAAELTSP